MFPHGHSLSVNGMDAAGANGGGMIMDGARGVGVRGVNAGVQCECGHRQPHMVDGARGVVHLV